MAWEAKGKYHWEESETKYVICFTRNSGRNVYDAWAPRLREKGYDPIGNSTDPAEARAMCKAHHESRSKQNATS